MKLKLAYIGSPFFSADFLEKILTDKNLPVKVKFVVTQPDKKVGRKQILTPSPVKQIAEKYHLSSIEYSVLSIQEKELKNIDLALVYAFGEIIPANLLNLPRYGFWNIHPSLLPYFRGPSPIAYPLMLGEKLTGVTLMKMDELIDHGPIIDQTELKIENSDKRPELEKKLTLLGFQLFKRVILDLDSRLHGNDNGTMEQWNNDSLITQDDSQASFTSFLKKSDGFIPLKILQAAIEGKNEPFIPLPLARYQKKNPQFNVPALPLWSRIYHLYLGLTPWPGLWTIIPIKEKDLRLKIVDLRLEKEKLEIIKLQFEGKKEVDFKTFSRAYGLV